MLSILVLSTKKPYSSFLKSAFFRKFISKLKYWNRSKFPPKPLLRGSDPPAPLTLAKFPIPLMFPAGSYDIHPRHNKMACDYLFSGESNIWYSSVTTSVQHFTKRSWNLQSFSFCSEIFLRVMLLIC